MKHKRLFIHLLSIIILAAGLGLSILIQPEPGGYVRLAKGLAMVALVFILASLLFNGKLVPLITSCGPFFSLSFSSGTVLTPAADLPTTLAGFGSPLSSSALYYRCILNLFTQTKSFINKQTSACQIGMH